MDRNEAKRRIDSENSPAGLSHVSQSATRPSMRPAEKRVVAVVDDDPTTRRILRHWLGAEGYEIR